MIAVPNILQSLAQYFYLFLPVAAITIVFVGMTPAVRPTDRSGAGARVPSSSDAERKLPV